MPWQYDNAISYDELNTGRTAICLIEFYLILNSLGRDESGRQIEAGGEPESSNI